MAAAILNAKDVLSGEQGEVWVTLDDGQRVNMMHVVDITASVSYNKDSLPILGKRGQGHRKTGEDYSGSMTVYYVTSIFREKAQEYKDTGKDFYFDLQIINHDNTTSAGEQVVTLLGCNIDNMDLAKLDAANSHLEESMDFTFEDWKLEKSFDILDGLI